jgi:hypothetical protein
VDATFIGVHEYDTRLPAWGRADRQDELHGMQALRRDLDRVHPLPLVGDDRPDWRTLARDPRALDAELARANLDVRTLELESGHFRDRNPALWTGEAIFGAVALMLRDFAPPTARADLLEERLSAVGPFLAEAEMLFDADLPAPWVERATRECAAAKRLLTDGLDRWMLDYGIHGLALRALLAEASEAVAAFDWFASELAKSTTKVNWDGMAIGTEAYATLLRRGHFVSESPSELLPRAERALADAQARLVEITREVAGTPEELQRRLAADHGDAADYLDAFKRRWDECHEFARVHDLVSWPHPWPLRYVPQPEWAREAAGDLYFLHYRAPSPFDRFKIHQYLVAPIEPDASPAQVQRTLSAWNRSQITLNHVVHHGALGHHVQNWHAATRGRSRIGRIAAVDGASRIAMLLGGSMAEGWACYATDLAEEFGFLTPLERAAEQQSRVRQLARAVLDIRLHCGERGFAESVAFMRDTLGMPDAAATAEVTKASMFPGTPVMYWIGTQGIVDLRARMEARQGADFSLRAFHDTLLSWGSIPVPLVSKLMLEGHAA